MKKQNSPHTKQGVEESSVSHENRRTPYRSVIPDKNEDTTQQIKCKDCHVQLHRELNLKEKQLEKT